MTLKNYKTIAENCSKSTFTQFLPVGLHRKILNLLTNNFLVVYFVILGSIPLTKI